MPVFTRMPVFRYRCTLSVQAFLQIIMSCLGALLINVISNDISTAGQKLSSLLMIIVAYIPLSIATFFVWCVVNNFFTEVSRQPQETQDLELHDHQNSIFINIQDPGRLDHQHTERVDPQGQGGLHPQDRPHLNDQDKGRAPDQQDTRSSSDPSVVESKQFRLLIENLRRRFEENKLAGFLDRKASASFPPRDIPISACIEQIHYSIKVTASPAHAQLMKDDKGKTVHTKQPVADVGAVSQSGDVTLPGDLQTGNKVLRKRKSNR